MGGFRSFSRRRVAATLALSVAFAVGLAVRWAIETPVYALGSDHVQHLLLAKSLAAGEGFHSGGSQHPDLTRPPLIPVLTAGLSWLTGDVDTAAKILVLLASALVVVPLYVLARDTFGRRAGLAALPIGALSGLVATAGLMTEPLFVLFGLSAAAATWSAVRRGRFAGLLAAGALSGACALARFEGLALVPPLALWAAVGAGRPYRDPATRTRALFALALVGGALSVYGPYAAWVSVKLGRWEPAPGIQYLRDTRTVSDRLRLRDVEEGPHVEWFERSQYLVAADHRRRILETYFTEGTLLAPDPGMAGTDGPIDSEATPPRWIDLAKRRAAITLRNLRDIPYNLHAAGLLPVVAVVLGAAGVTAALRTRRSRRALGYLASLAAVAFAPALSHVEARFLYLPFALGLVVSAGGWGWLARRLPLPRGGAARVVRVAVHVGIALAIAYTGVRRHHMGHSGRFQVASFRKALAPVVARELPPGPILAVQMHVPFWAGRPYRPIPVGDIGVVLDYARSEGAAGLVFDDKNDLPRRPHLSVLMQDPPPDGLRLVLSRPLPEGGEVRVFALSDPL